MTKVAEICVKLHELKLPKATELIEEKIEETLTVLQLSQYPLDTQPNKKCSIKNNEIDPALSASSRCIP